MGAVLNRVAHTMRICRSAHMGVILAAIALATLGVILQGRSEPGAVARQRALTLVEAVAPLSAMAATCHVFSVDRDAGCLDVLRSYPQSRLRLVLERFAAGVLYVVGGVLSTILALAVWTPLAAGEACRAFVPPMLLLTGIALLAAAVVRNWVAGLAAGAVY